MLTPRIISIDPGNTQSGVVLYDPVCSSPVVFAEVWQNLFLRNVLDVKGFISSDIGEVVLTGPHVLVIEWIASYGMPVGAEVFDTCRWVGRFQEAWGGDSTLMFRREVKTHLCGSMKAKDANVWQAIVDRFGGKVSAIGRKSSPGPLYGVTSHARAALAVALTYLDTKGKA